ncbi:MAG: hypothetical protein LBU95_05630 [Rikenellaceae bacterium]|jgi:hypothetical protein|nr:hypothetical protein [Rikenellaceae bacterium]
MTQTVIVYIIGALLLAWIVWRVTRIFTGKAPVSPCDSCATGCAARAAFWTRQKAGADKAGGAGCPHCGPKRYSKSGPAVICRAGALFLFLDIL